MNLLKSRNRLASIPDVGGELYKGDIKLAVESSADFKVTNQFKKCLRTTESLRIGMDSWSEDEGIIIIVSVQKPIPLGSILSQMSIVERVNEKSDNIAVVLKESAISIE